MRVKSGRVRLLQDGSEGSGPVLYWMSREQRVHENWALLFAQDLAIDQKKSLIVLFTLLPGYPGAEWRHYHAMIEGLKEVEKDLSRYHIPFFVSVGDPPVTVTKFCNEHHVSVIVTDFDPLRIKREWKKKVSENLNNTLFEVDAHNIIPCWIASNKAEYGAYTLRPKLKKLMDEYLGPYPPVLSQEPLPHGNKSIEWDTITISLNKDAKVLPVRNFMPGYAAAKKRMKKFIAEKLADYEQKRNDPNAAGTSLLSPYLHFGHLSAQQVVLEIMQQPELINSAAAFIEELVVRRELSDNYCYYTPQYDSFHSFPRWAQDTLNLHRRDERAYLYTREQLENAQTHDELWNAAQIQMVEGGTMHGYLRMYWAKKILEWTTSPEEALETAILLNDKYQLDGRDPNGYTGCCWAIGGLHDRPWGERPVFGKIRYMNAAGCSRKFDTRRFIESIKEQYPHPG